MKVWFLPVVLVILPVLVAAPVRGDEPPANVRPEIRLTTPEEVERGTAIRAFIDARSIRSASATLQLPDGRTTALPAYPVASTAGGLDRWQVLIGVDHTVEGGVAELEITVHTDRGSRLLERAIAIVPRVFRSEEIALNTALSELRETTDPRRARESRELWDLLHVVDPAGRHHSGTLILPVEEFRRTSTFGDRRVFRYADGRVVRSYHNGLDLAAPTGAPVYASGRGLVVMAMDRLITGGTVVIEHQPGMYSLYYHLEDVVVEEGFLVSQGERLGTVGMTGLATGPHLHWEVRLGGVAVDPEWFLQEPLVDTGGLTGALSTVP